MAKDEESELSPIAEELAQRARDLVGLMDNAVNTFSQWVQGIGNTTNATVAAASKLIL